MSLPGGQLGFLIVVNLLVFVLAFFLDFFELSFIVVPLLGPVADKLGIDLIWFGVLLGVNMQTSFMHPPFGFALFYLRSVAPAKEYVDKVTGKLTAPVTTGQIYWGAIPFVLIQVVMVALVIALPADGRWSTRRRARRSIPDTTTARRSRRSTRAMRPMTSSRTCDVGRQARRRAGAGRGSRQGDRARTQGRAAPQPRARKKEKTPEEKAAEEIEKALRGGK